MNSIIKQILLERFNTLGEIESFLNPEYSEIYHGLFDRKKMKDLSKAALKIWEIIEQKKLIAIYADYDADGVPGAALLYSFFKEINYNDCVKVYFPHREKDGFGLHNNIIDTINNDGCDLIITIDLGITNIEEVNYANDKGIKVIITDHHLPHDHLPKAYAILNPKQSKCEYKEKMLCGTAVVFKLICELIEIARSKNYQIHKAFEKWSLDLVAFATISDMVPLQGENRVFAKYGLTVFRKALRPGINTLITELKLKKEFIDENDFGFSIAPLINSASRMSHASDAFNLLKSSNKVEANVYSKKLFELNKIRKNYSKEIVSSLDSYIDENKNEKIFAFGDVKLSPTLLGPVCINVVNRLQVPAFIYGKAESDVFRGSCRSLNNIDVVKIMNNFPKDFFVEFGGHKASGGFAFETYKEKEFKILLKKAYEKYLIENENNAIDNNTELLKKYEINYDDINSEFLNDLFKMKPFGMGNENPIFVIKNIFLNEIIFYGKTKEHLKFVVSSFINSKNIVKKLLPDFFDYRNDYAAEKNIEMLKLNFISFFANNNLMHLQKKFSNKIAYNIVCVFEESYFLGKKEIRAKVLDIYENK